MGDPLTAHSQCPCNNRRAIAMTQAFRWPSYSDFYKSSTYSRFPQEHRSAPGNLQFEMIRVEQDTHDFVDPSVPEVVIAMPLSVAENCTYSWNMGEGWRNELAIPGRVMVIPSCKQSHWKVSGERELLLITVPTATLSKVLYSITSRTITEVFSRLGEKTWEGTFFASAITTLWGLTNSEGPAHRILADATLTSIISGLFIMGGDTQADEKSIALPVWRQKKVEAYVDENLHEEINVFGMAEACGLSGRHFSRAFSEELGLTPHRWLTLKRISRAKELLLKNEMDIAQIADLCGFSNQSHFSRVFKDIVGKPPGRWRATE
ncbi:MULTISPECIES: AraC family transcriptional regulator [Pseudomonas]|nr:MULTISPECIES: AraC family transcriptional regulator [Pseudomonas]MCK6191181.1 AraC family transcriptional regulator [Pseudomonas sp. EYE_354]